MQVFRIPNLPLPSKHSIIYKVSAQIVSLPREKEAAHTATLCKADYAIICKLTNHERPQYPHLDYSDRYSNFHKLL